MIYFHLGHTCPSFLFIIHLLCHSEIKGFVIDYICLTVLGKMIIFVSLMTNDNIFFNFGQGTGVSGFSRLRYLFSLMRIYRLQRLVRVFGISRVIVLRVKVSVKGRFSELLIFAKESWR